MSLSPPSVDNPIPELVNDETYQRLDQHDLLHEKRVRDYRMRQRYKALRDEGMSASEAIENIRQDHPYLQFDTVRKIVYKCC